MEVNGQLHYPAASPPRETVPGTLWIGCWVGTKAGLDTVSKRKIPSPSRDPIVQPVASRFTD